MNLKAPEVLEYVLGSRDTSDSASGDNHVESNEPSGGCARPQPGRNHRRIFGEGEPQIATALDEAARLVNERIASSDALYHDTQHTALVTLCVQDILRGRRLRQRQVCALSQE